MYEVEVKVPAALERVRSRLHEREATSLGAVTQKDRYYDAPHRSFAGTDEALRIRHETDPTDGTETARVTYKGPLVDEESKTREEVETAIDDAEAMDAILTKLGYTVVATVRKERDRFTLDRYTVTLDAVEGVGAFVEVETEASEDEIESAREGAYDLLERIGLDPADQLRVSYLELLLES